MEDSIIQLAHGGGGTRMNELIREIFANRFSNEHIDGMSDAANIDLTSSRIAFTTDGFVVKPHFFPGGDIGKLSICGTVNDLASAASRPLYISASFILEEGFAITDLERIATSMAETAKTAGVKIVAGDTKVVERGSCDGIFISTSGIGIRLTKEIMAPTRIRPGDAILVNGAVGDHGMAIMATREGLSLESTIKSDCAPLGGLMEAILTAAPDVRFMRDATRGGLATVLCESCDGMEFGIECEEATIPLNSSTTAACELLGLDPLYSANEGKIVAVVPADEAEAALVAMRGHELGRDAAIIGHATGGRAGHVSLITTLGSRRMLVRKSGEQMPRIC